MKSLVIIDYQKDFVSDNLTEEILRAAQRTYAAGTIPVATYDSHDEN